MEKRLRRFVSTLALLLGMFSVLNAQPDNREDALQHIFNVLSGEELGISDPEKNLQRGAWEALTYFDENDSLSVENLSEAVPDYYNFKSDHLFLKLMDPGNADGYGTEMKVNYRLNNEGEILLIDNRTGTVKSRWRIMYLDKNYLALDMGDLRMFFIHTPEQE